MVLVMCAGNSCRSPFFAALLSSAVRVTITSGAYLRPAASVDSRAVLAAQTLASEGLVDAGLPEALARHRPTMVSPEQLADTSFTVILDESLARFWNRQRGTKGRPIRALFENALIAAPVRFVAASDDAFELGRCGGSDEAVVAAYTRQQRALVSNAADVARWLRHLAD